MNSAPSIRGSLSAYEFFLVLLACAGAAPALRAQAVAPPLAPPVAEKDNTIVLTPFEVSASSDMGYQATETLAGSRLKTDLKDVATQVNVMTKEFLEDLSITTLDDAIQYSLNTETRYEAIDVTDPGAMGVNDTLEVVSGQGGRTRGLTAPNNSHDFFDTFIRQDSYNTERFTFSNGPNSILFGNSSPSGTIDTTFKRARLDRQMFEVSTRANASTGSVRLSTDLNQPLWWNRVALRVAGLTDRDKSWRKPGEYNQDRIYAALIVKPFKWATVRAYNESANYHQYPVKNTLVQDHVTPWIQAGRPLFNNHISQTMPTAAQMPSLFGGSLLYVAAAERAIIPYNQSGLITDRGPIRAQSGMARTIGYDNLIPAPNNFERSILDQSLYPFDRNFNGNLAQARYRSWVRGAIAEINPLRKLFIEIGYNEEEMRNRGIDFMNGNVHELYADPNLYLEDRVTPNPYAGQFYVENAIGGVNSFARKNWGRKQQQRASISYELGFEQRQDWRKWLGLHRFAFLADRLESRSISEQSLLTTSPFVQTPTPGGNAYQFVAGTGNVLLNSQRVGFRYYIDPARGDWTIRVPFDPMRDGTYTQPGWVDANGTQVQLMTFDPSGGHINAPNAARNKVDSTAFVTQSFFLDRRIIVSYARRRDSVDILGDPAPRADWNFDRLITSGINWQTIRSEVPVNTVKSVVTHPLRWMSLSYSESTTQQVRTQVVRHLDGTIATLGAGKGKDYGITLRWKDKISVRINRYENVGLGDRSVIAASATPTTSLGSYGPNLKQTVAALERSYQVVAPDYDPANNRVAPPSILAEGSGRFNYYQSDLARVTAPDAFIGGQINGRYEAISDSRAEGYELTLAGNPTQAWRISLTGAKNESVESNIGGQFWEFIEERLPFWGAPGNLDKVLPVGGQGTRTFRQALAVAAQNWYYLQQADGRANNNIRKYRVTATTRYGFGQGRLKGVFVGANYVWRSAATVGYPTVTVTDNPWIIPGVTGSIFDVSDIKRPYRGGALTSFDAFLGYNRKLHDGKVQWRVQLNIRNVLDRKDPLVQRVLTNGQGALYTVQEPRSFILTNTFSL